MRTHAQKRDGAGGAGTQRDPPQRGPSSLARLQRSVGNRAMQRFFTESHGEGEARAAEDRARRAPADGAVLAGDALSNTGRRYFARLVGEAAGRARVHIGGSADKLAKLAGAESLSYGNDVFIPGDRFSPDSPEGRGLLAHELAHVARAASGPPRLARKPDEIEPHYPTPAEHEEIERILARDAPPGTAPVQQPGQPPPPTVDRGRVLTAAEQVALAASLEQPLFDTIDSMDQTTVSSTDPILDESEGFEVIEKARKDVLAKFAGYISHGVTMTRDEKTTAADREARNEVLVHYSLSPTVATAFAFTVIDSFCSECKEKLKDLHKDSRAAVRTALVAAATTKHKEKLETVARKRVGGSHKGVSSEVFVRPDTRSGVYANAAHEFIHHLTHPAFTAAFEDERNILEGFTEFMTRMVAPDSTGYREEYAGISSMVGAMSASTAIAGSVDESMRLAYFKGRLDLVGWTANSDDERKAVTAAGGSGEWNAATAKEKAEDYHKRAIAVLGPKSNVLGFGLYFTRNFGLDRPILSVEYVRVLKTENYGEKQYLLQGQLLGTPEEKPTLGASLGVAAERQGSWFYVQGGLRAVGTIDLDADKKRVDLAPFVGVGLRGWQRVRVGLEGIVLLPVVGAGLENTDVGIGGTVSIELGARK